MSVHNFTRGQPQPGPDLIVEGVYLGTSQALSDAVSVFGTTHIVCCSLDCQCAQHDGTGYYVHKIPWTASIETVCPSVELAAALGFIREARASAKRVCVHCPSGLLSTAVVVAYVIGTNGVSCAEAIQFVKSRRPCAELSPSAADQLDSAAAAGSRQASPAISRQGSPVPRHRQSAVRHVRFEEAANQTHQLTPRASNLGDDTESASSTVQLDSRHPVASPTLVRTLSPSFGAEPVMGVPQIVRANPLSESAVSLNSAGSSESLDVEFHQGVVIAQTLASAMEIHVFEHASSEGMVASASLCPTCGRQRDGNTSVEMSEQGGHNRFLCCVRLQHKEQETLCPVCGLQATNTGPRGPGLFLNRHGLVQLAPLSPHLMLAQDAVFRIGASPVPVGTDGMSQANRVALIVHLAGAGEVMRVTGSLALGSIRFSFPPPSGAAIGAIEVQRGFSGTRYIIIGADQRPRAVARRPLLGGGLQLFSALTGTSIGYVHSVASEGRFQFRNTDRCLLASGASSVDQWGDLRCVLKVKAGVDSAIMVSMCTLWSAITFPRSSGV
eukprot:TRINITY_DN2750_c0_g1_i1.p1 TRINITY_DN2750_c0_g1~~TRINITY_DN2750_c0_g1_i1.p1  ORF type:complete len:554 (+),score=27.78 TRINITY_DN2750_c0_g1_i1:45-1706(+)